MTKRWQPHAIALTVGLAVLAAPGATGAASARTNPKAAIQPRGGKAARVDLCRVSRSATVVKEGEATVALVAHSDGAPHVVGRPLRRRPLDGYTPREVTKGRWL